MIVYAPDMHIVHLESGHKSMAPTSNIRQVTWELVNHPVHPQNEGPKVAKLTSVTWLDVAATIRASQHQEDNYQVQWRISLNGPRPDPVIIGTEFRALVFGKDEDSSSDAVLLHREPAISFKPNSVQEFMQHTDRPGTVPARPTSIREAAELEMIPGYNPDVQGFFTLTLPGQIRLNQMNGGVIVQIRNHNSVIKSGLQIESVQLVQA
ncbi:hypothetical protein BX616_007549 [Lobosporangium transversale]|uniref:Uncharacterized protein n=1 Tax=Lobosporangium transversale TaxID=64571 RepID=A0A1Y2G6Z7_9FUNG|nr:hypothetical protein BCR41DRAFT_401776 [Lobosporangium transversale]KAF9914796.1 hypothetical protein BX616_007549 [Lobosporangium transversale]ORY99503.1 hypothetical protein BCR41DRAFT_401776 [Lobosporangium transversale]|eukprot:XP_021875829.1 hypothetical protein BCR41DRAFT_401776 [Lobosporangium transversale]